MINEENRSKEKLDDAIPDIAELIIESYGGGEGSMLSIERETFPTLKDLYDEVRSHPTGDTLFNFICHELYETVDEGAERSVGKLDKAINELLRVRNAVAVELGIGAGVYVTPDILSRFTNATQSLTLGDVVTE